MTSTPVPERKPTLVVRARSAGEPQADSTLMAHSGVFRCASGDDSGCACGADGAGTVESVVARPGAPLDLAVRADMERRFGSDFSRVRVHTDSAAADSARRIDALAYTVGDDVVFAAGRFAPASPQGKRLLAHELTHVVQGASRPATSARGAVSRPGEAAEAVADRVADAVTADRPVTVPAGPPPAPVARAAASGIHSGHHDGQGEFVPAKENASDTYHYRVWGTWREGDDLRSFGERIFRAWVTWRFGPLPEPVRRQVLHEVYAGALTRMHGGVGVPGDQYNIGISRELLVKLRVVSGEAERERRLAEERRVVAEDQAAGGLDEADLGKLSVDRRLVLLEARIRAFWTGGKDEDAILRLLETTPDDQAGELSRRLATDHTGRETFLDALDRVVDLGNNLALHVQLTRLHLRSLSPEEGAKALERATVLPWHDVMGLAPGDQSVTFSATRGAGGRITIQYHAGVGTLDPVGPFAGELKALPFDVKIGGKAYDPDQLFTVHDWDENRFVTLRARDLVAYVHIGTRKFVQDVATVASLVAPVGQAASVAGRAALFTLERVLPLVTLAVEENRLNLVRWFPVWGPRMIRFVEIANLGAGVWGLANFARSGISLFREWRAVRNSRSLLEAAAHSDEAEQAAARLERESDRFLDAAEKYRLEEVPFQGKPANDVTSWTEALAARKAEQAEREAHLVEQEAQGLLAEGTTGAASERAVASASGGGGRGPVPPPPPLPPGTANVRTPARTATPAPPSGKQPRRIPEGVGRGTGDALERDVLQAYREARPLSAETAERFALHEAIGKGDPKNEFNRIGRVLEERFAQLRKAGKPAPRVNLDVLKEDSAAFVMRHPDLRPDFERFSAQYARLEGKASRTPGESQFLRDFDEFFIRRSLEAVGDPSVRKGAIGRRRPDIVEFALDKDLAVVTDITQRGGSAWHRFKTRFYQQVLHEMLPDLAVEAHELEHTKSTFLGVVK